MPFLKIDVTARSNQLFRHGLMTICGRGIERCGPKRDLVVDEGLRAFEADVLATCLD